jgi:hypothetical protein
MMAEPQTVGTLHVLMHPGSLLETKKKRGNPVSEGDLNIERKLLDVFRRKIDLLGTDDVLLIFSSAGRGHLDDIRKNEEWTLIERYARQRLGRRCISLSSPSFLRGDAAQTQEKTGLGRVGQILQSRGFKILQDTPCEVWGQTAIICLPETAEQLFKHFQLTAYPVIPAQSTELSLLPPELIPGVEKAIQKRNPRTRLVNRR